jgi:replicative DNA helicase
MVTADKLPPYDIEAEEACIASILVDEEAIGRVEGVVHPDDFYRDQNRWAYEACLALWERNEPINQVTLAHELSRREKLDDSGGIPYLARIVGELATPVGVEYYAHIVKRDATYRAMITAGSQIVQVAYQGGPDLEGAITRAENLVMTLRRSQRMSDLVPLRTLLSSSGDARHRRAVRRVDRVDPYGLHGPRHVAGWIPQVGSRDLRGAAQRRQVAAAA